MLFEVLFSLFSFFLWWTPKMKGKKAEKNNETLSYDRATIYIVYFCLIYGMVISWPRNVSLRQSHTLETSSVFRILFFITLILTFFSLSLPEYL